MPLLEQAVSAASSVAIVSITLADRLARLFFTSIRVAGMLLGVPGHSLVMQINTAIQTTRPQVT